MLYIGRKITVAVMNSIQKSPVKALNDATNMASAPALLSPSKRARTTSSLSDENNQTGQHPILRFAKMTEHATTPTRGSKLAAGYDLYR